MAQIIQRVRKNPDEQIDAYSRRKAKAARGLCRQAGLWSDRWFQRAVKWDAHIRRHPASAPGAIVLWHGAEWLQQRRARWAATNSIRANSWSILAGRTDTRCSSGIVHQRWDAGVALAKERAASTAPGR